MYTDVSINEFRDAFLSSRTYKGNFSYEGLGALYEYLEEWERETDERYFFDMVGLCCEFAEYDSAWEAMKQYHPDDMPVEGEDGDDLLEIAEKNEKAALEWLEERTTVIPVEGGGVIISQDL